MDGMMSIDGSLYEDDLQKLKPPPSIAVSGPGNAGLYLDLYSARAGELKSVGSHTHEVPKTETQRLLATPDTRSFSLSTPDVEQFITATTTAVPAAATTGVSVTSHTPTPTKFLQPGGPVTEEQEMYAQGFIDALEQIQRRVGDDEIVTSGNVTGTQSTALSSAASSVIHHTHAHPVAQLSVPSSLSNCKFESPAAAETAPNPSLASAAPTYVTATLDFINIAPSQSDGSASFTARHPHDSFASISSYPGMVFPQAHIHGTPLPAAGDAFPHAAAAGYNTVVGSGGFAHAGSFGSAVNPDLFREIVPADMNTQEQMKVDRKKARNRIAASKCRLRRLQRESDLNDKVKNLRDHNQELKSEVSGLREQINNLKKALLQHMQTGCQVNLPEGFRSELDSMSSE